MIRLLTARRPSTLTVVPHLYDLADDGPAAGRLRSLDGHLVVMAWLPSRATYWLIRRLGIQDANGTAGPHVWCIDLRGYATAEACDEAIGRMVSEGPGEEKGSGVFVRKRLSRAETPLANKDSGPRFSAEGEGAAGGRAAQADEIQEPTRARWYPVVDYDRCANCLECLNFCLFGVYGLDASETLVVEQPDACRPGCPACARVCPSGAILFPEHADPTISGGSDDRRGQRPVDGPQPLNILDPFRTAGDSRDLRETSDRRSVPSSSAETPPSEASDGSRLDDLVDELDDLDL